ncbi:hypothetical protein GWI33_010448 [Rhynchophorus ferrugineus]|uniref:Uncharacterized protein n=1 Tax=Rhynchophorus ferrugineus TaxID=354439 RepID=A0A834IAS0_RHYFE|nr:hypothetical protein GWI33_010448 [Rhynchophorus ferrugineus]
MTSLSRLGHHGNFFTWKLSPKLTDSTSPENADRQTKSSSRLACPPISISSLGRHAIDPLHPSALLFHAGRRVLILPGSSGYFISINGPRDRVLETTFVRI